MKSNALLMLMLIPALLKAQSTSKFVIDPSSSFTLSGVSNVNEFDCELKEGFCEDQLSIGYSHKNGNVYFKNANLSVSVSKFDCNSKYITRDMKKTLKEEEFPFMEFELLSIENFTSNKNTCPMAEALVTISGHTNKYYLKYELTPLTDSTYQIKMGSDFKMKDFNIDPPTAMMGLIKVHDTITVEIDLLLKLL
uniref:YceI family protein n=1 Tax=Fulvivirga sp. TaxID=1931237 RepID=UPI0040494ECF